VDDRSRPAPHSGSRWEPTAVPSLLGAEHSAPPVTSAPPARRRRLARRGGVAAIAAGLIALGGFGGLAVGHAVDRGSGDGDVVQGPVPDDDDGYGDGFGTHAGDDGSSDDGDGTA
jgi:hypothetical protein